MYVKKSDHPLSCGHWRALNRQELEHQSFFHLLLLDWLSLEIAKLDSVLVEQSLGNEF